MGEPAWRLLELVAIATVIAAAYAGAMEAMITANCSRTSLAMGASALSLGVALLGFFGMQLL